jgi:hypothetical protein
MDKGWWERFWSHWAKEKPQDARTWSKIVNDIAAEYTVANPSLNTCMWLLNSLYNATKRKNTLLIYGVAYNDSAPVYMLMQWVQKFEFEERRAKCFWILSGAYSTRGFGHVSRVLDAALPTYACRTFDAHIINFLFNAYLYAAYDFGPGTPDPEEIEQSAYAARFVRNNIAYTLQDVESLAHTIVTFLMETNKYTGMPPEEEVSFVVWGGSYVHCAQNNIKPCRDFVLHDRFFSILSSRFA